MQFGLYNFYLRDALLCILSVVLNWMLCQLLAKLSDKLLDNGVESELNKEEIVITLVIYRLFRVSKYSDMLPNFRYWNFYHNVVKKFRANTFIFNKISKPLVLGYFNQSNIIYWSHRVDNDVPMTLSFQYTATLLEILMYRHCSLPYLPECVFGWQIKK